MKQITAPTMQEALQIAKKELGEDAVLLNTHKTNGNSITVVFAVNEIAPINFADLPDDDIEPMPATVDIKRASTAGTVVSHPAFPILREALRYHAVPDDLSVSLMKQVQSQHIPAGELYDVAEKLLAEALGKLLVFKPIATAAAIPPARVLMLVGPHGAGKTSAIAKLATELTLHKRRVVLISADSERMGALDTLQGLAELMKCECRIVDSRNDLKEIVKQYIGQAWVLVDSTGANIYEFKQLKALGELAGLQGVEPILTCPAGMDREEATEMAGVFSFLPIERMIVTRLDSTRRLGSLFAAMTAGGYGLANLSQSASPSEACLPASAPALARLMLRQARERVTH
jgi:flagellar biosynthesis protein FlhF